VTLATDRRPKRAKQAQLEERVRFALQDYREIEGRFDRIVSVGMFEHVGTLSPPDQCVEALIRHSPE
jgi:cyclopropane-fatty-acyl-phospholipid synthase